MADKYLKNNGGSLKEVAFAQSSSGVADAGKGVGLNSSGQIDITMFPTGLGTPTKLITATEVLAAGALVNIYGDSTSTSVRNANGTVDGKYVHGFVLSPVSMSASATVYLDGINNQVSGMIPGDVFMATTAGQGTNTAPNSSGNVVQNIGTAISATEVIFERGKPIVLA